MNNFATDVKDTLIKLIHDISNVSFLFCKNSNTDFTRNRKLNFETMIHMMLTMEGGSLSKEMLEYFNFSTDTATVSAFNQQRKKIMPAAFEFLFHEFNALYLGTKKYEGYNLIACDGSDINISRNPSDIDTYFHSKSFGKGFNQLHLNAFYNILERRYTDALIQPARKENEYRAMATMIDRSNINDKTIIMADRGYESYNIFAHAEKKGWNYLIRVKDKNSSGIVSGFKIPEEGEFDITISTILTRKQTRQVKENKNTYKFLPNNSTFDYLDLHTKKFYPMTLRIVRVKLAEDSYECLITNLSKEQFPPKKLKELYHLRWGIETSFRELKYAIGLTNFHAKKVAYIIQEIFARMIMYNFCELITTNVIITQKDTKHLYQVNYTMAIHICRYFFKILKDKKPPDVSKLIQKYILPIRLERSDPRKVKVQSSISFLYRVA
ncbi:IS4 family transposase [Vallitalea guaymasensis]|uniref:IS4 family transposase n=1 Tax=Vallitalea guaymasensis TaxID=1185412 RepID=A0A8J8SE70_9FIRM|nr:IS4 family transposase [Vallitalea guaymasensis]QUH28632.1 IS4 family transposase [Vallitalea guaymasensis]QUH31567.1 IS4 family transposase [Vallitalea guaymasensis]